MGDDGTEDDAFRAGVSGALAKLSADLAGEIGPRNTEQVDEYIEHHEFGLALELIVSLILRHGLDRRPYRGAVDGLFEAMGMADSEYASEWRKRLGEA